MIFPTESVLALRGSLEDRVNSGEISELEAYREALTADPEDPRAIRLLALLAEEEGDVATAESLAWRWLHADPLSHEVFRLIGRLLTSKPEQVARAAAYSRLGHEKLHFDPEAETESPAPAVDLEYQEPPEVMQELEPHRLLHKMWTASTGEVDRATVDRALELGDGIAPLLRGVLNLFAEDLLDEVDDALVVRSLALLGELGDPKSLTAICPFLPLQDETLSDAASWAVQRIGFRKPAETLSEIRAIVEEAEAAEVGVLAEQLCTIPDVPGRLDVLKEIAGRILDFTGDDRAAVTLAVISAAWIMEGLDGPLGTQLLEEYQQDLTPETRRELKRARKSLSGVGPYTPEPETLTVFEICCPEFQAVDEGEPYVRSEPKLGRNDPCWCGSGKKYKKCHLAAEESR